MRLRCSQTVLNSNLQYVSHAIAARPTHPILANVLLVADAETSKLTLTGFDLSLGIQTTFHATVEESGALTLPSRLFVDIVSHLAVDSPISLHCPPEETLLQLKATTGNYTLQGLPADDFPALPITQGGTMVPLPLPALRSGLGRTLFATSTDEAKQYLTGVHITVTADRLEFAATDGHRLAVSKQVQPTTSDAEPGADPDSDALATRDSSSDFAVTVPARSLRELDRLLATSDRSLDVSLYCDQGQIVFQWSDQVITSRTLEGNYPRYPELIPPGFSRCVVMDRRLLIAALERVAILAQQRNSVVRLRSDIDKKHLHVSADVQDVGSGSESLAIQDGEGDDFEVAFNVRYLLEGLKVVLVPEVKLQLNSPKSPAVISPVEKGVDFTYLVMPIQLVQ